MTGILVKISDWFNLKWHKQIYVNMVYLTYILLLLSLTGVMVISPLYLSTIKMLTLYYICFVLIFRFNPFVNSQNKFDIYDRKIAFSAGLTLFLTTSLYQVFQQFFTKTITTTVTTPINKIKDYLLNKIHIV